MGRGDLLEVKKIGRRYVTLTDKGRRFEIHDSGRESIEEIDSKVILSGRVCIQCQEKFGGLVFSA